MSNKDKEEVNNKKTVTIELDIELYNELKYLVDKDDREIQGYIKVLFKEHLGNTKSIFKKRATTINANLFKPRIILLMVRNNYSKEQAIEEVYKESRDRIKEIFNFDHFIQFEDLFNDWKPVIFKNN